MFMLSAQLLVHASQAGTLINKRLLWVNKCNVNQCHTAQVCECQDCDDTQGWGRMRAQHIHSTRAAGLHQLLATSSLVMS